MIMIYSLYILNRAGGLIYQKDFNKGLKKITTNDYLILSGILHGVHAIASNISPPSAIPSTIYNNPSFTNTNKSGLKSIETDFFKMFIFQSLTGIKFVLITSNNPISKEPENINTSNPDSFSSSDISINRNINETESILRKIYALYSDYVMKNPFYSLEMPIRCDLFDLKLTDLIKSFSQP
ncbi:hypothetical protein PACTADRAFT_51128 [Pachysolen tannophilus NRRL Y-2460]|uniref:Trafficking protein particle complex subunit n=1 Tax=Pachysolen tannophilus NRRL Y-2460 TaxID=669874 RepID=A0A1E4TRF8_PACTA|nr:hypothetical protein PACTADRAFT_51128 [Pachysolen tannophilus NRRL Y-2460]